MDDVLHHPLVIVTKESMTKTRQLYGVEDVKKIKESLDIIDDWLKKQPHLADAAKYLNHLVKEKMFFLAKGSIEETKRRIDKMLTYRGMLPEITMNRKMHEFESLCEAIKYVPLPNLHPVDQSRISVTQFVSGKHESFSLLSYVRYCFLVGEYRFLFDYSIAERFILDMENYDLGFFNKINPVLAKRAGMLSTEGIGVKIKGVHILNAPSFVNKVISVFKLAMKPKVASRIFVHSTIEDLHKHIPKEILPQEYGGNEESCTKLNEQWVNVLKSEEATKKIEEFDKLISDESKRPTGKFNEEYMGMPGAFRNLAVD